MDMILVLSCRVGGHIGGACLHKLSVIFRGNFIDRMLRHCLYIGSYFFARSILLPVIRKLHAAAFGFLKTDRKTCELRLRLGLRLR